MTSDESAATDEALLGRLHRRVIDDRVLASGPPTSRSQAVDLLAPIVAAEEPLLTDGRVREVAGLLAARVTGLGRLETLLDDPSVTEVLVNGPGSVWVERQGRLQVAPITMDRAAIERVIERILTPLGLRCDRSSPVVDARLPDGSRLHAVVPPVAVDGPYLTVRRFAARPLPLEAFGGDDTLTSLLDWAVRAGWNLLVSGGTSSGKTTLLNALATRIPARERVVTIEETAELRLPLEHVVRLEARPANAEGAGSVTVEDLVKAALRMRPDRLVVGEVRGSEALHMVDALNTGHEGSLSTIHANTPVDALERLGALAGRGGDAGRSYACSQLHRSVDAVIQLSRAVSGQRRIDEVAEVVAAAPGESPQVRPLWVAGRGLLDRPSRATRRVHVAAFGGVPGRSLTPPSPGRNGRVPC